MNELLLDVRNLKTSFFTHIGEVQAVRGVSFTIRKGETVGIVGESGSGKSVTLMSVMQLLKYPGKVTAGEAIYNGENLLEKSEKQMRKFRGASLSMIFQDPMTSLNPTLKVGEQVMETIRIHEKVSRKEAREKTIELFNLVKIPSAEQRLESYPHEFSGGMRQRVMIAIALSCNPDLLIADEPTTALDVTIQEQIINLMKGIQSKLDTSIVLITHDLGVVAEIAERIIVMYGGMIMEEGSAEAIFYRPRHPYTIGLLESIPRIDDLEKKKLVPIKGSPPDMLKPPVGCPFAPRCDFAMTICTLQCPEYKQLEGDRKSQCWLLHDDAPVNSEFEEKCQGSSWYE